MNFLHRFLKKAEISNFITLCPVGVESLHADGQTGVTKLIAAFRMFANAPKNTSHYAMLTEEDNFWTWLCLSGHVYWTCCEAHSCAAGQCKRL